jgi:hypothetical protein
VAFGDHSAGLFVVAADNFQGRLATDDVVDVNSTFAGYHENIARDTSDKGLAIQSATRIVEYGRYED